MKLKLALILMGAVSLNSMASIHDFNKATWNMQGRGDVNSWSASLLNMIKQANKQGNNLPTVIAVQEGGSGPGRYVNGVFQGGQTVIEEAEPGTSNSHTQVVRSGFPNNSSPPLTEYTWLNGSNLYHVYGALSDYSFINGREIPGRVNSYLVSTRQADEVILLYSASMRTPGQNSARPNFGIRIGNSFFFSIHTSSSGNTAAGSESADRLNEIDTYVRSRGPQYDWAVMGDFNSNPDTVTANATAYRNLDNIQIRRTRSPTQRSGGVLDYMIFRESLNNPGPAIQGPATLFNAGLMPILDSDHIPIRFWDILSGSGK